MSKIEINKLTNANVYLNGNNLLGRAEEVQLPQIKHKMAEHKALGMIGSAEFFSGIDKMECKIKWNALYPNVLRTCANPFMAAMIQVRANLETYNGKSFPNSSGGQKPKIKEALGEIHILTSSRFRWLLAFLACGRTPPISSSCGHIAFSSVCVKSAFASLLRGSCD